MTDYIVSLNKIINNLDASLAVLDASLSKDMGEELLVEMKMKLHEAITAYEHITHQAPCRPPHS